MIDGISYEHPTHWRVYDLQKVREERGWSLEELADRSGVEYADLYNAEHGAGLLRVDIQQVAKTLGVTQEAIMRKETPYFEDASPGMQPILIQAWEQMRAARRERPAGRGRGPERQKTDNPYEVTRPHFEVPIIDMLQQPPTIMMGNYTKYFFDGGRFRSPRGNIQHGGTVPIFGFSDLRLQMQPPIHEQEVADRAKIRYAELRVLLQFRRWATVEQWLGLFDAIGRPDPNLMMWGKHPQLVRIESWPALWKLVTDHMSVVPNQWESAVTDRECAWRAAGSVHENA